MSESFQELLDDYRDEVRRGERCINTNDLAAARLRVESAYATLRARVAELDAALQEQTRLRLAEIDLHEEQEDALVEAVRAEVREHALEAGRIEALYWAYEHYADDAGVCTPATLWVADALADIRSSTPTPEPPHA